jgi:hypothetical protein
MEEAYHHQRRSSLGSIGATQPFDALLADRRASQVAWNYASATQNFAPGMIVGINQPNKFQLDSLQEKYTQITSSIIELFLWVQRCLKQVLSCSF